MRRGYGTSAWTDEVVTGRTNHANDASVKVGISEFVVLTGIDAHRSEIRVIDCKCILARWIRYSKGAQSSRHGEQRKKESHDFDCSKFDGFDCFARVSETL